MSDVFRGVIWALGAFACALLLAAKPASAQDGTAGLVAQVPAPDGGEPHTGEIDVPAGKSMILRFERPVREVLIGDPALADIIPLTERSVYLLGKAVGGTSLTAFGPNRQLLAVMDLQVGYDTLNLKRRLFETMPGEGVEVRSAGGSLVLSGQASSPAAAQAAADLAARYGGESVVNMIETGASSQVMLKVKIAEVERTAAKALGVNSRVLDREATSFGGAGFDLLTGLANATFDGVTSFTSALADFEVGEFDIGLAIDLLEERGVATVLAEPTLIAVSGQAASFLAGGEFPVPVSSTPDATTGIVRVGIEFKEFGIRLGFTPTVIGDTISLLVAPEVSEIDPSVSVVLNNVTIPGLSTRRAATTVELKNGQSFAIAGLLSQNFRDDLSQVPGVGSIPVLGALARSTGYQRNETELAIIVTPYIVEPSDPATLRLPTDHFVRPNELEVFLLGRTEGGSVEASFVRADARPALDAPAGYVLP